MTNLQDGAPPLSPQQLRRLWLWSPIAAGGALSALVAGIVLLPLWTGLQRDTQRLRTLEGLEQEVGLLRGQITAMEGEESKAALLNARLLDLISGSGDLSTFLAKLDQEARAAGVQLDLYEPQPEPEAPAAGQAQGGSPAAGQGEKEGEAPDPAEAALKGLKKQSRIVSARGRFPALLDFLRRLEGLNVLVAQSDLNLLLETAKNPDPKDTSPPPVVLKLVVSLYGPPPTADRDVAARPPAAAP